MATTTPNYGWPVPTSTDYVKDGATAIEALGDAIDATVFGLGGPTWTNYTPTISATSGSITTTTVNSAKYAQSNKVVFLMFDITVNNNGTGSGSLNVTLPSGKNASTLNYVGCGRELLVTGSSLSVYAESATNMRVHTYNNGYPVGTGQRIVGSLTYQVA
jgi:hypothetical protein